MASPLAGSIAHRRVRSLTACPMVTNGRFHMHKRAGENTTDLIKGSQVKNLRMIKRH